MPKNKKLVKRPTNIKPFSYTIIDEEGNVARRKVKGHQRSYWIDPNGRKNEISFKFGNIDAKEAEKLGWLDKRGNIKTDCPAGIYGMKGVGINVGKRIKNSNYDLEKFYDDLTEKIPEKDRKFFEMIESGKIMAREERRKEKLKKSREIELPKIERRIRQINISLLQLGKELYEDIYPPLRLYQDKPDISRSESELAELYKEAAFKKQMKIRKFESKKTELEKKKEKWSR